MDGNIETQNRTLDMSRHFAAPPALMFKLWTQPEHITRWWGCPMMVTCDAETDPRLGGRFRVIMQLEDDSTHIITGTYTQFDPPSALTMTWTWELEDGSLGHETTVQVRFAEDGEGTFLTLHQAVFEDQETRDSHNEGWGTSFDRLMAYVSSLDADTA